MNGGEQASNCGSCGSEKPWLLHNISLRGEYRRLCTSCVLKTHVGLFCPVCFEVYEGISASNDDRVKCLKCPSLAHMACVSEDARSTYVCSSCSNPSFVFFNVGGSSKNDQEKTPEGGGGGELNHRAIDLNSAKIIVAAARIASISMSKAATTARNIMEKRVMEAASSRKRAREALERLVYLGNKAKERRIASPSPVVVPVIEPKEQKEQKKKAKGYSAVSAAVAAQKRIQNQYRAMGNNKVGAVSVTSSSIRSNIVERLVGLNAPNSVQRPSTNVASTNEAVESNGSAPVAGPRQLQSPEKINEKKVDNLVHLLNHVLQEEKDKDVSLPDTTVPTPPPNPPQNDHGAKEEEQVKSKALADDGKTPT